MVINTSSRIPKHVQTAALLKRRIQKGDYVPGSNFPPVRMLGAELGVSSNVVQRAVQILEKEGVVETQHGIGIRVLPSDRSRRIPLTFGLVYPFHPDRSFAGTIHILAEKATDLQNNHCIIKSTCGDPKEERETIEKCLDSGVEGLMVWPCPGEENVEFFRKIARRTPLVFIDRTFDSVPVPGVTLDWARVGREVVQYLRQREYRRVLILEDPLSISSFRQMYTAMRETIKTLSGERRFDIVEVEGSRFLDLYPVHPKECVEKYTTDFEKILAADAYEAFFTPYDEFIDRIYACTSLRRQFPMQQIVSQTNTRPTPRSLEFYDLKVREWVGDFEAMFRRATDILHERVYLKSRIQTQIRIPCFSVIRTCDRIREGLKK
jgi:DNA-binding LacI/PurR family transcriptional regulator